MKLNHVGYQQQHRATIFQQLDIRLMPMTMVYFLFFLLVALTAASFFVLATTWLPVVVAKISYFIFMLAAGICHSMLFPKCLPDVYHSGIKWQLLYCILLATSVLFVSLFLFTVIGFVIPAYCLFGAATFLIPSVIHLSRKYFNNKFTVTEYDPWLLPAIPSERKASLFINSIAINLQVKVKCYDLQEKRYSIVIPTHLKLGDIFHRFLVENETKPLSIQLFDTDGDPFAWKFILKKKTRNKPLDPARSLKANGIMKNNTILAERVLLIMPKQPGEIKKTVIK